MPNFNSQDRIPMTNSEIPHSASLLVTWL